MPYGGSIALPSERASKLGHLSVINDPLVQQILSEFERRTADDGTSAGLEGSLEQALVAEPLEFVVSIDGSVSDIPNTLAKHKMLSYIKVGALGLSLRQLEKLQTPIVDPNLVTELLQRGADTFSTVVPLSNVTIPGQRLFDSIRSVLYATFNHLFDGDIFRTLRFLVSREWLSNFQMTAHFACPFCGHEVSVPRSETEFPCSSCNHGLTLVDYLELTSGLAEEGNDSRVAIDLMVILENLLVIHYLKSLVEQGLSSRTLILKDGPLMLAHQYSRLVDPIREYLAYLHGEGTDFYLAGVEKQGAFVNHIPEIERQLQDGQIFIPSNQYILTYIKSGGSEETLYGEKVLYGAKSYFRIDPRNTLVLNLPYGLYKKDIVASGIFGLDRTTSTLKHLGSRQFQNALLPIVAINKIVSLSVYPSNKILERFAEATLSHGS